MALLLEVLGLVGEVERLRVEGKVPRHEFLESTDAGSEQVLFAELLGAWEMIDPLIILHPPHKFLSDIGINPVDIDLLLGF